MASISWLETANEDARNVRAASRSASSSAGGSRISVATPEEAIREGRMFDTMCTVQRMHEKNPDVQVGTHFFKPKNHWSTFDVVIVSPNMADLAAAKKPDGVSWVPNSTAVVAPDFVRGPGGAPLRFFKHGGIPWDLPGYTDHFSVVGRVVNHDEASQ